MRPLVASIASGRFRSTWNLEAITGLLASRFASAPLYRKRGSMEAADRPRNGMGACWSGPLPSGQRARTRARACLQVGARAAGGPRVDSPAQDAGRGPHPLELQGVTQGFSRASRHWAGTAALLQAPAQLRRCSNPLIAGQAVPARDAAACGLRIRNSAF